MKTEIEFIKGTFSADDASRVLFEVINDKIKFHKLRILSIKERNIGDPSHSEERVAKLKEAKEEIFDLIELARKEGKRLELKSNIEIKFI